MWVAMSSYSSACRTAMSAWSRARNPTLPTRSIGRSYPARPPPKIGLMLTLNHLVTSGTFSLDGGTWDVDNNVWVVGDDSEVVIIDAAHTAGLIVDAVARRNVVAVIVTHSHDDHVTVAPELADALHAPVLLHPGDDVLWKMSHPEETYWNLDGDQR